MAPSLLPAKFNDGSVKIRSKTLYIEPGSPWQNGWRDARELAQLGCEYFFNAIGRLP